jgi:hypothetical protein
MIALGIYEFPEWEGQLFENPNIEIDINHKAHADLVNKKVDVKIDINTNYGFMLKDIPVDSFDFDLNNNQHIEVLHGRVMNALANYLVTP